MYTRNYKLTLLTDLYDFVIDRTEALGPTIGVDLAYLFGAILKDTYCEWPPNRSIVHLLKSWGRWPEIAQYIREVDL